MTCYLFFFVVVVVVDWLRALFGISFDWSPSPGAMNNELEKLKEKK